MALAPLLLSTIANCGVQEAVVVWDPVAGNPIVSFNGDTPAKSTLTAVRNLIFCALAKKPILQVWSFQSNAAFKRLTTKGIVNALTFTEDGNFMFLGIEKSIHMYQICSGCLLAVLEASHMAPIGQLIVSNQPEQSRPSLLISADTSGVLACWSLATVMIGGGGVMAEARDNNEETSSPSQIPLWYVVQASRTLPSSAFVADGRMVASAGTEGLKLFDSLTGQMLHSFFANSRPLLSLCALAHDDRFIFAGTENGILRTIWLKNVQDKTSYEASFRRCFAETELSATEKAICRLAASPIEADLRLLAVGSRRGVVEVLRVDAALVRLQRFSLIPPTQNVLNTETRITGLIFVPRPGWLFDGSTSSGSGINSVAVAKDDTVEKDSTEQFTAIRPIKRHMGWQADDLLYIRLPNLKRERLLDSNIQYIYQDDFLQSSKKEGTVLQTPFTVNAALSSKNTDTEETQSNLLTKLETENRKLVKRNAELMRMLVADELHY